MQSLRISELPPVLLGGRVSDPLVGHAQNSNKVLFNDRYFTYTKVIKNLPETFYDPKVYLRFIDADGLQDNGTLRTLFDGRNSISSGGNPIVDFGAGSWAAPLDSYVNAAVRWTDDDTVTAGSFVVGRQYEILTVGTTDFTAIGAASNAVGVFFTATGEGSGTGTAYDGTYPADQIEVGLIYEIKSVGTTDFTLIGAAANTVGQKFTATGAGAGTGTVFRTKGGRHGDIAASLYSSGGTDTVRLWVNVYDYDDQNDNRLALLESTNGTTFTESGEIQFAGGNFGATVADVIQLPDGSEFMICGEDAGVSRGFQKEARYSDDGGATWTSVGTVVELSSDEASPRYFGMPVGRFVGIYSEGGTSYLYMSIPVSRISADWPEGNMIARRAVADLKTPGLWEIYRHSLSVIRGPQMGGVWNVDYIPQQEGHQWGVTNEFGMIDFDDVNTSDMNTLRESPYFKQDLISYKHTGAVRTVNTLALKDWSYWPFQDGDTVQISNMGRYLASGLSFGSNTFLTYDQSAPGARWVVERQGEFFWLFKNADALTISLATGGAGLYANRRAIGLPIEARTQDASVAANNIEHHWQVVLHGDDRPDVMSLVNRASSLALASDCSQRPALVGATDQMWRVEVVG